MNDRGRAFESEPQLPAGNGEVVEFPQGIARILGDGSYPSADSAWEVFLDQFSPLILKTAAYAHRRSGGNAEPNDACMDAYTFIIEKLRKDGFKKLRSFPGSDEDALTRWLVVVVRRLCTDFWRHRYGRPRPSTPELERDTRRRLVDEIWDPRDSSEFPTPNTSDPEWELRHRERREALESVLGELEPRDQLLLALRFEDDLSAQRISDIVNLPTPFHVYRQLNRILKDLRKRLEGRGFDDPDL